MSPTSFVVLTLFGLALGAELPVPRFDGRIVGGIPTTIEEYPYQLSLRFNNYHMCGASIISRFFALTAAHCVSDGNFKGITLHAGTTYQNKTGSRHKARVIFVHPQYRGQDYDFALIKVDIPFPIGQSRIQSIGLCSVEPSAGQTSVITGWGALSSGGSSPNQLQVVNVPVISRTACQKKYSQKSITKRMICAAMENGGKDACQGDSGGPMVVNGKQCGVVSWGLGCAAAQYPGVYSNVADQLRWIKRIARI